MTQATELVEVTQEDRDAVAGYLLLCDVMPGMSPGTVRCGADDHDLLVQAFARHRLSTRSPAPEQVEAVDKAIKAAQHEPGCHITDNPTDWSRPYCSCLAKGRAAIAALGASPR